jgi:hypothetical protein
MTSLSRRELRFAGVTFISALVIATGTTGCSHMGERGLASGERLAVSSESSVNHGGKIGEYHISLEGRYPIDSDTEFASVVEVFRGVKIATEIGNDLAEYKSKPLKYIQSYETFAKATETNGHALSYIIRSVPHRLEKHTSWIKFDCDDTFTREAGHGYWHQECWADMKYQQTATYMSDFHQVSTCAQYNGYAKCEFVTGGVAKPIHIDADFVTKFVIKEFFGAGDASATQSAHYSVKSQMHAFYAASALLRLKPPYFTPSGNVDAARVRDAVEVYAQNEFNAVENSDSAPSSMDDHSSVVITGPTEH